MNFNVDINKDKTVATVTASLNCSKTRLPFEQRKVVRTNAIVERFTQEHPKLKIESVSGPNKISNCHGPSQASGTWTITLEKKLTKPPRAKPPRTKAPIKTKTGA
jgi:hypothetical protein